jgi:hypothetical protein
MLDGVVLVGAGRTADSLLPRLVALAPLTVIDTSESALSELRASEEVDASRLTLRVADGTSRLVLEDLRGGGDVGLVAATGSDRHNVEACRIARDLGYGPIVGIAIDAKAAPAYEELGVRCVVRATLLGEAVDRALRFDGIAVAANVGSGRGEIVEFVVLAGSPAVGQTLADLHAEGWRIAAIYRDGRLVIPTGATAIEAEDRVLLVGEADLVSVVAEQLRVGRPMFPMPYGRNVVAYMPKGRDEALEVEARALALATRALGLVRAWPDAPAASGLLEQGASKPDERPKQLHDVPLNSSLLAEQLAALRAAMPGVLATRLQSRSFWAAVLGRGGAASELCNRAEVPVMFMKGAGAYARVVHPVLDDALDERVAFAAIDLARMFSVPMSVIRVRLPAYFGGADDAVDRIVSSLERRLRMYGVPFELVTLTGNPVRCVAGFTTSTDLVVVGRQATGADGFSSPDVALRIARRSPGSVLVRTLRPS